MRKRLAAVLAGAAVLALVVAAGAQPQTQDGWQAFCLMDGGGDWFGPCRAIVSHSSMDRARHDEQQHGGDRTADYTGTCVGDVQAPPETQDAWQAFCLLPDGHDDWFGPCRAIVSHSSMDRARHDDEHHGGDRTADYTGTCVGDVQAPPETQDAWQAFCLLPDGHDDWFGPCRAIVSHSSMDRARHDDEHHGGDRTADYTGTCVP